MRDDLNSGPQQAKLLDVKIGRWSRHYHFFRLRKDATVERVAVVNLRPSLSRVLDVSEGLDLGVEVYGGILLVAGSWRLRLWESVLVLVSGGGYVSGWPGRPCPEHPIRTAWLY